MGNAITRQCWKWRGVWITAPLMVLIIMGIRATGALQALEWLLWDQLSRRRPLEPQETRVVIVSIEEADIAKLEQWPISDATLAEVITLIRQEQPRAIGLDLYRNLPIEPGQEQLLDVFQNTPSLFGIEKAVGDHYGAAIAPPPVLKELGQVSASDIVIDQDGTVRRILLSLRDPKGNTILSLAAQLALTYLADDGIELSIVRGNPQHLALGRAEFLPLHPNSGGYVRADAGGYQILSNYRYLQEPIPTISISTLLNGQAPPGIFYDRVVLIGTTAASLGDRFQTPFADRFQPLPGIPGVLVHADFVSQILSAALEGRPLLRPLPAPAEWLWVMVGATVGAMYGWTLRSPLSTASSIVVTGSGLSLAAYLFLLQGWWVPIVPSLLALAGASLFNKGYVLWTTLILSNQELERYSQTLEQKVTERTLELQSKNEQLEREIRDRQQAEAELKLLFAAMTDTIIVFDEQGQYLKYRQPNPRLSYKLGIQHIGRTVHDVWPKHIADLSLDAIKRTLYRHRLKKYFRAGQPMADHHHQDITVEYCLPIQGQQIWFSANVSPISDHTVLWVARDITHRKEAELALKTAKESAEAANHAKSQFLSTMSHELRTPLNAILGFTQLLRRDRTLSPSQQESVQIISRSGEHLLDLINDVLTMSKIEAGRMTLRPVRFSLTSLLETLIHMFTLQAQPKGVALSLNCHANVPKYIIADESKLRQVLINLLSNAIKFTPAGHVTLSVEVDYILPTPAPRSDPSSASPCVLWFAVEDTGAGISEAELTRLFKPFEQTETGRRSQQGTGLGLAISRQFVHLMGGDISVSSHVNQGSIFRFSIQADLADTADVVEAPFRTVVGLVPNQTPYRILIADDSPEQQSLLKRLVESAGFRGHDVGDPSQLSHQWQTWAPDLLLLNDPFAGQTARHWIQYLQTLDEARSPAQPDSRTKIIVLTSNAFLPDLDPPHPPPWDDTLLKPFQDSVLFEKIAGLLSAQYVYAEHGPIPSPVPTPSSPPPIPPEELKRLPSDWIQTLHQAATQVDSDQVQACVQSISHSHPQVAATILRLLHDFRFDQIIDLTELYSKHTKSV
jgi:CHASE2 domain-containing sensor protein/signal transduction histidine kinase/DNA-binding response OmpR family regulator